MLPVLHHYDIFPKVFPVGKPTQITVRPLGAPGKLPEKLRITIHRLDWGRTHTCTGLDLTTAPDADGAVRFTFTAEKECEHYVRIHNLVDETKPYVQLSVYALDPDMACRIPLRGDLHMHTCRSDGKDDPAYVAANYRGYGYDFLFITDHRRYYPSLEAIADYAPADPALNLMPGEEVHLPLTDVHIVNAGGRWSVNALLEGNKTFEEVGDDPRYRAVDGNPPAPISVEEYERQVHAIAESDELADCPEDVDRISYAACLWNYRHIQEAGGLAIFAHPYWITNVWQVPEALTRYTLKKHHFSAYEVLGGESYYTQNGFQTAIYYDEYREGRVHPIVGSTDSHNSTENNRNGRICSTIVFAHKNECEDIKASILDRYSVAVDTISAEYRLVGEFRFQKYANFLMENWYPLHDRLCAADGEIMREYFFGEADASEVAAMHRKADRMFARYFAQG